MANKPDMQATASGNLVFWAKTYQARNWRVIPTAFKSKACYIDEWQNYIVAEKDLVSAFAEPCNIGVVLAPSGLTDIDIDSPHAQPFLHWLPPTTVRWGRAGHPNSHYLYKGARSSQTFENESGTIVEIRSQGRYAVVPPSVHPSGEEYVWVQDKEPGIGDGLEEAATRIAIAATLLPAWHKGNRHDLALATAGLLLKTGWSAENTLDVVLAVAKAAGDHEVDDRAKAVQTTAENIKKGSPVAGFSKLAGIIGDKDAGRIASWVKAETQDIGELAGGCARSVRTKRRVATCVREDLASRGVFYRTSGTGELLFFHKTERQLYALDSLEFRALCGHLYGINGKEPAWPYIDEHLQAYCARDAEVAEFFRFARYQGKKLYVHAGGHRVLRLDGTKVDSIDNGDDGVFFHRDPSLAPINPKYDFSGTPVRDRLVKVANATEPDCLDLYEIFIYSLFFEAILPTKPIVLFTGPKGSGKTSAGRALKRFLHGPAANVDTGLTTKEDAFWATICHSSLVCIDNVDSLVPWLADALAVVATGAIFKRRKLYETNTLVEYVPRCFIMVTSRKPQSFTRDDVVDRLLLIDVERRKDFIDESHLVATLDAERDRIWGELLTNLNKMVAELKKQLPMQPMSHRLADWARLAIRFAPLLGIGAIEEKLKAMETSKVAFALDDDPLAQGLEEWLAAHPDHDFIASGELFQQINSLYASKDQKWAISSARAFGTHLRNLRSELESRYKIEEKPGPGNKKLFRFTKLNAAGHQETHAVAELLNEF
jgi:hypothetical protein